MFNKKAILVLEIIIFSGFGMIWTSFDITEMDENRSRTVKCLTPWIFPTKKRLIERRSRSKAFYKGPPTAPAGIACRLARVLPGLPRSGGGSSSARARARARLELGASSSSSSARAVVGQSHSHMGICLFFQKQANAASHVADAACHAPYAASHAADAACHAADAASHAADEACHAASAASHAADAASYAADVAGHAADASASSSVFEHGSSGGRSVTFSYGHLPVYSKKFCLGAGRPGTPIDF